MTETIGVSERGCESMGWCDVLKNELNSETFRGKTLFRYKQRFLNTAKPTVMIEFQQVPGVCVLYRMFNVLNY